MSAIIRHGVKLEPGPQDPGPRDPGTRDLEPLSNFKKFKSGIRDPAKV